MLENRQTGTLLPVGFYGSSKTTAVRDRMIELNKTINWKPASTVQRPFREMVGEFGGLEPLSSPVYRGTLPTGIWVSEDGTEKKCIGSVKELVEETEKAIQAGIMKENPFKDFKVGDYSKENYEKIDLHRPYVDDIILVSPTGQPMYREKDLIDVWFEFAVRMPYAQVHYPFENKELIDNRTNFPADFITPRGVRPDPAVGSSRYTLSQPWCSIPWHSRISYPTDWCLMPKGNKMSKRLGNAVDPFDTIEKQGSDPLRWYMITNSQPWDNLKFDIAGVEEVKRKFSGKHRITRTVSSPCTLI